MEHKKNVSIHSPTVSFQPYCVISALLCHFNDNSCQSIRLISICNLTLFNLLLTIHDTSWQHGISSWQHNSTLDNTFLPLENSVSSISTSTYTNTNDHLHQHYRPLTPTLTTTPPFNTRVLLNRRENFSANFFMFRVFAPSEQQLNCHFLGLFTSHVLSVEKGYCHYVCPSLLHLA